MRGSYSREEGKHWMLRGDVSVMLDRMFKEYARVKDVLKGV